MADPTPPLVRSIAEVPAAPVDSARGATIQVLIGADDGAPNFVTRLFTLAPGGRIPAHSHPTIEHQQVVLEGEMTLALDRREVTVKAGDCLLIPPGVAHWYENRGQVPVRFLCIIPRTETYATDWLEPAERTAR